MIENTLLDWLDVTVITLVQGVYVTFVTLVHKLAHLLCYPPY